MFFLDVQLIGDAMYSGIGFSYYLQVGAVDNIKMFYFCFVLDIWMIQDEYYGIRLF